MQCNLLGPLFSPVARQGTEGRPCSFFFEEEGGGLAKYDLEVRFSKIH